MAKDKKPSIFADRGTIGSSDELDEYGVWVKSEPQSFQEADGFSTEIPDNDVTDSTISGLDDFPDFDTFGATIQGSNTSSNIPKDDYDLPDFESDDNTAEEDNNSDFFNFGELTEPAEFNSAESDSEEPVFEDDESLESNESSDSVVSFDSDESLDFIDPFNSEESGEISIELASNTATADINTSPVQTAVKETSKESSGQDLSTQLLMKIAEELSSIRSELSSLKKEFSGLRAAAPQSAEEEKHYPIEEDDEKISLTGDELNNILNTADFTEEAGSDAGISLSENEDDSEELSISTADLDIELDLSDSNLENLEGETKLGNSGFFDADDQISSDLEISDESILEFDSEETDELKEIRENGVEPMASAPAPEDTSYLTEDPLAENFDTEEMPADLSADLPEEISEEPLDLSGAVIDEPDLSSEIQDNPLEEPSLEDITISLDLSDLDSVELEQEEDDTPIPLQEDTLKTDEDLFVPEDFVVEEDSFSEILFSEEESQEEIIVEEDGFSEVLSVEESPEEFVVEEITEEVEDFLSEPEDNIADFPEAPISNDSASVQDASGIPANLKTELRTVLSYMDQLLEALPDDKIEEFAKSEYYDTYKKLFKELGLA